VLIGVKEDDKEDPRHRAQDKPLQMNDSRDGCHSHEVGLNPSEYVVLGEL